MKYFKTSASRGKGDKIEITCSEFEKATKRMFPFEQIDENKAVVQYGICPYCLNPVRLVGLYKKIKRKPHGKHAGKSISGLPKWNQVKYEYCPFKAKNRKPIEDEAQLLEITEDTIALYKLLIDNFDKVVYVISQELGIRCSTGFWEKALEQFLSSKAYCYPWLTEYNLPYIFAYHGMQHKNLFGQLFLVGSDLYNLLESRTDVCFISLNTNNKSRYKKLTNAGKFLNLQFRFTNHLQKGVCGEDLKETMSFCIDDATTKQTIYKRTIKFNQNLFMDLVKHHSEPFNNQKQALLNIAEKYMKKIDTT